MLYAMLGLTAVKNCLGAARNDLAMLWKTMFLHFKW